MTSYGFYDFQLGELTPKFHEAAKQRFRRLDRISADIKAMERLFAKNAVPKFDYVSKESEQEEEVALSWDTDSQRIMVSVISAENEVWTPLIGAPAIIRNEVNDLRLLPLLMEDAILSLQEAESQQ